MRDRIHNPAYRGKGKALMNDCEVFGLGDAVLLGGATPRGAKLAYKTYGGCYAQNTKQPELRFRALLTSGGSQRTEFMRA